MRSSIRMLRSLRGPTFFVFLCLVLAGATVQAQSYLNFEGKLTRPICLSPDGTRLFAVNTADARLSVFDVTHPLNPFLIAEIPVGIEPVSVNARNNDEAWVVNEESDSVSIVSVSNNIVVDTLYAKDEPADVVFAGGKAFVSEARNHQLAVFDVSTHALLTNIVLFGECPRSLAVNSNATSVYAAFALSGNRTTIISLSNAPAQSPATNNPPKVSLIVDAMDPAWNPSVIQFTMPDNDVAEIDVATMTSNRYFTRIGTVNLGLAVQPGSGALFVANTDARNLVHFESNLKGFFSTNRVSRVDVSSGLSTPYDLNPGFDPANFTLANRTNALSQPTALVFGPSGAFLYLAAFGSDRIARMDAASGSVLARIELCPTASGSAVDSRHMRGPRGLALKPGVALYVLNRVSGTISIIALPGETVACEIPIGSCDPTPSVIRQGRGFLYDAKHSANGTVSCATCHVDAEMDMLAWDLGDPGGQPETHESITVIAFGTLQTNTTTVHPMKGPMVTQTLRGLDSLDPFHWRGDRTNFTHFNLAFTNLLGGTALSDSDMNAYRDFINTIRFEPNPNQTLDRQFPASLPGFAGNPQTGLTNFINNFTGNFASNLTCATCHGFTAGTSRLIINGDSFQVFQDFKVPHLRNVYQKQNYNPTPGASSIGGFGLTHDGAFRNAFDFLSRPFFQALSTDTDSKTHLNAFLQCFDTGISPAVGYARTLNSTNVNSPAISNDWALLEFQARFTANVELIVKGTLDGVPHGLFYQASLNLYSTDSTNLPSLTHTQLVAKVLAGDTLTIMGAPPGSGQRMAVDRDLNGVLDADEPLPSLQISQSAGKLIVAWPLAAAGFRLQQATNLTSAAWTNNTSSVEIVGASNVVTNDIPAATTYFRLRK
jgi:DNA-binding beta-propeller fold protein YncE